MKPVRIVLLIFSPNVGKELFLSPMLLRTKFDGMFVGTGWDLFLEMIS